MTNFVQQIIRYLRAYDPKHVVIACNTATALALPSIRPAFPDLPISGVIGPGAKAAVIAAGAKAVPIIGVIATEATIRSRAYERAIHHRRNHARLLLRSTPLLVPIIEEGRRGNDPLVRLAIEQYLAPLMKHGMDVLVLGCTHYPILKETICEIVGPTVRVIDSAEQSAQDVAFRLRARGMVRKAMSFDPQLQDDEGPHERPGTGTLRTFVTDDPPRFRKLASRLLGVEIELPTWVSPDELYQLPEDEPGRMSVPA